MRLSTTLAPAALGLLPGIFAGTGGLAQTSDQTPSAGTAAATVQVAQVTDPTQFVQMAATVNILGIRSSQLARDEARSRSVRDFAERLIDDHNAAAKAMKDAAQQAGIEVPQEISTGDKQKPEQLKAAGDFDKAYVREWTQAHKDAVELFLGFSQIGRSGTMQAFAVGTLPRLEEHQALPRDLPAS